MSELGDMGRKTIIGSLWIVTILIGVCFGYAWGAGNKTQSADVLMAQATPSPALATPTPSATVPSPPDSADISPTLPSPLTPTPNTSVCSKTGFAQKWEYLTPYVVKQGDTLQNIAQEQLHDETRVNEILQINGVGLVIGATIYVPPATISKSSGNLKQVYGKLLEKNNTSWHLGFSSDPKGQGILIPSFWFEKIANKDSFRIGDCIKVFFDDGYTVYSVGLQER